MNASPRNVKQNVIFVKNKLDNNQNDSKRFWRNIHDIWPKKKTDSSIITLIDPNTNCEVAHEETANFINWFFTSIGPNQENLMIFGNYC